MGRLDLPDPRRDEDTAVRFTEIVPVLSEAEVDVLAGAGHGESREETARRRGTRPETVKTQREAAMRKLGVRNVTQAVAVALRAGVIE